MPYKPQHRLTRDLTYVRDDHNRLYRVRKSRNGVKAADQIKSEVYAVTREVKK